MAVLVPMATMIVEAGTGDAVKLVVEAGNGPGAEGVNQAIPQAWPCRIAACSALAYRATGIMPRCQW